MMLLPSVMEMRPSRGRSDGAAQMQIDVAGQLGVGVLEAQLRR